jgi:hypothetical protein
MKFNGVAAEFFGFIEASEAAFDFTEVTKGGGVGGKKGDRSFDHIGACLAVPALIIEEAEHVEGVGMLGIVAEQFTVKSFSLGHASGAVAFDGFIEKIGF